ncbi:MAG: hypothetical protein EBZ49_01705 [Proteobacteria bacterium]|nr:hypothetical protein [Pseudomonadota bacterium]
MSIDIKNKIKKERNRSFLAKDFDTFRSELLDYSRTYFPDKIQDFSEASLGGLFLDMASYVGDTLSYYLDHQFTELNPTTAVERKNILTHLKNAGVKPVGSSPSSVYVKFYIRVPAEQAADMSYKPMLSSLPVIRASTTCKSASGINFNLTEDLDFSETDDDGEFIATVTVYTTDNLGNPTQFIMTRMGLCISGNETTDSFNLTTQHVPFREITLLSPDISDIISVTDSENNEYYQVESLSQDTVFRAISNVGPDGNMVPMNLEVIAAPRRYTSSFDPTTRMTKIRFGAGDAETLDDDIIPDPSELSLSLYGKKYFSRFSIDPNSLLQTQTLGISPKATTISVRYRHGGGINHNVAAGSIRSLNVLVMDFLSSPSSSVSTLVRSSVEVRNIDPARGGDTAPSIEDLRARIPTAKQMQSRIVSKQDLLSRIYTMPNVFGRVFRAGISDNPENPLAAQLYIISKDRFGNLATSPDALKKNLSTYLNEFRLISDAIDILDARVSNYTVTFGVVSAPGSNKGSVVQSVISRVRDVLRLENFQIDQPIVIDDIINVIINTPGVVSLVSLDILPKNGNDQGRVYSDFYINFENSTRNKIITAPRGTIFELKYPEHDIVGTAI